MLHTFRSVSFLALGLTSASAGAQGVLLSFETELPGEAGLAGDLDGDGVSEILVTEGNTIGLDLGGPVWVHSGAGGALLHSWSPEQLYDGFGTAWDVLSDVDGDGVNDLVVGAPLRTLDPTHLPYIQIRSGRTGALILRLEGKDRDSAFGGRLASLGDVDGDGRGDFATTFFTEHWPSVPVGDLILTVRSGSNGKPLWRARFDAPVGVTSYLGALARHPDLDQDGLEDLALGLRVPGEVCVVSSATGAVLRSYAQPLPAGTKAGFGNTLAVIGDTDGDGAEELLVGAEGQIFGPVGTHGAMATGAAYVFSGATGALSYTIPNNGGLGFGSSVSAFGDYDGDGARDFLIGNWRLRHSCCVFSPGALEVRSGRDGTRLVSFGQSSYGRARDAGDWNQDGRPDYLVGGRIGSLGYFHTELIADGLPAMATEFCAGTPGPCLPQIGWMGSPSLSAPDPLEVRGTGFDEGRRALLFFGPTAQFKPFGSGLLCAGGGLTRVPAGNTGGGPSTFCPGTARVLLSKAYFAQKGLLAGSSFRAQFYTYGPSGNPGAFGLSDALSVTVLP